MAGGGQTTFELKHYIEEQDGCKKIYFVDSTGTFNEVVDGETNTTGYESLVTSDSITSASITITPYGYTSGYVFDFVIATNVITDATVTDPNGVVTNIFADLLFDTFPFSADKPFIILNEWLGGEEDSEFPFGQYDIEYNVSDGTDTYTSSSENLVVCTVCCCVNNAASNLEATDCECQNDALDKASNLRMFLDAAIYAAENGEMDKARNLLTTANDLCQGKCTNC